MAGSVLPVVTAHGEGRAVFEGETIDSMAVALRYVDSTGTPTERYPDNPNGSVGGITGVTNADGRVTILMPHPERLLRFENFSWAPDGWKGKSPWAKMFDNAREWVNESG
jgi:phosphoribosylformylglycinamidine synthase